MNIIIAGSREFIDYKMLSKALNRIIKKFYAEDSITIISGGARGADRLGEIYANNNKYELIKKPAEWDLYGKRAGIIRNEEMGKIADTLVAFWDMHSNGTRNMIEIALRKNLKIFVIDYKNRKIIEDFNYNIIK